MCYNCGCKMPYDDHGDKENITEEHFERSADTEAMGALESLRLRRMCLNCSRSRRRLMS